ncbi:WhiB family transcriptional regulator [Gulosibacter bifidus]|uniref:WhiB family transcriptional regulator n=1 Tax=Gulosibacter bifidus TaxID=272239 RepID=A0ABW5RJS0_9MICO
MIERHGANCTGDPRFTADGTHVNELKPICETCPVQPECCQYARKATPTGGIWAGQRHHTTKGTP